MSGQDYELVAQHLSALSEKVAGLEERVTEVEKVNARLEAAAFSTSRAMEEISRHWSAVYEAMRREEEMSDALSESIDFHLRKHADDTG